jgi:hypothetical protein
MRSILGGDPPEGYPEVGPWGEPDVSWRSAKDHIETANDFFECSKHLPSPILDEHHQIHDMFMDAIRTANDLHEQLGVHDNGGQVEDLEVDEVEEDHTRELEELYTNVSHPLYQGSHVSMISAIIVIFTMCSAHGVSNAFGDKLL